MSHKSIHKFTIFTPSIIRDAPGIDVEGKEPDFVAVIFPEGKHQFLLMEMKVGHNLLKMSFVGSKI